LTRADKAKLIDYLTSEFKEAEGIAVCDYRGMSVSELEGLRNLAKESGLKVRVVKNRLAKIALDSAEVDGLNLKDTNLLVWGVDQVAVAKSVQNFSKDSESFSIKSGSFGGEVFEPTQIEALSKMPSREELQATLLSTLSAPARNMVSVMSAPMRDFINVLNNKKEA
jgi:large subunit ribosomal protein L10